MRKIDMSESLTRACQQILRVPSVSSELPAEHLGNAKVVQFLAELVEAKLEVKVFNAPRRPRDKTIIVWPKGARFPARGGLALHTHLDTVSPGSISDWTLAPPFSGRIVDRKLVGLGAADVKCDAVCKIFALLQIVKNKGGSPTSPRNKTSIPFFVGSYSEEVGMYGMRWIAHSKIIRPKWALVGEPSEGNLSYANKGFNLATLSLPFRPVDYDGGPIRKIFKGKAAHSSAPNKADSALEKALYFLQQNPDFPVGEFKGSVAINVIPGTFELASSKKILPKACILKILELWNEHRKWKLKLKHKQSLSIFDPSTATSEWTIVRRVKNKIEIKFDVRTLSGNDEPDRTEPSSIFTSQETEKSFRRVRRSRPQAGFTIEREAPAFFENREGEFATWLKPTLMRGKKFITKSGANEARFYQDLGAEAFVHAPGVSYGNVHSPNESVSIKALAEAEAFYKRVIERLYF